MRAKLIVGLHQFNFNLGGNIMSKFDNRRRSGKVAMMLLSALFSGSNSQAKEMKGFDNKNLSVQFQSFSINKNDAKSTQSLERTQVATPITQRKFFKPLVITASALAIAVAGGFTIWGLTRNKKKDEKPDDNLVNNAGFPITAQSIINLENNSTVKNGDREELSAEENINKSMIFKKKIENSDVVNEEIKKYNENMIDEALLEGKDCLKADSKEIKKAIFAVFEKAVNDPGLINTNFDRLKMVGKNKIKINGFYVKYDHSIGNYVQLFFDNKESCGYKIFWRSDNVAVVHYIVWNNNNDNYRIVAAMVFKNFQYPFEIQKQEEESGNDDE